MHSFFQLENIHPGPASQVNYALDPFDWDITRTKKMTKKVASLPHRPLQAIRAAARVGGCVKTATRTKL